MYRFIEQNLKDWQQSNDFTPLIVCGARQVGKTYTIEKFAKNNFTNYVKVNFELEKEYKQYFEQNLDPHKFITALSLDKEINIEAGKTLIFFDEIQECPEAIQALRYFYEELPQLHVIAAGSLLEFTLNSAKFKMPVGRVSFQYMKPLSFSEFLLAQNKEALLDYIDKLNLAEGSNEIIHKKLLRELDYYYLVGGMPIAVKTYLSHKEDSDKGLSKVRQTHHRLLQSYQKDFGKYAKTSQHRDLEACFDYVAKSISKKFKYTHVYDEAKSANIKAAFELLEEAGLIYKIKRANNDLPLGVSASPKHFKALFLDIGLMNSSCNLDMDSFLLENASKNKFNGAIAEQFVGQELLTNFPFYQQAKLYYWERAEGSGSAEIDYLVSVANTIIPVEVKAGTTGTLRSLHQYMQKHNSSFGLRVSNKKLEFQNGILSIPNYASSQIERLITEQQ
ncbi:MAG: AAA family ATPase [Cyanobacteria bacterium]|nr:AAA family ATPase [Cyanobacteriota bacterium]